MRLAILAFWLWLFIPLPTLAQTTDDILAQVSEYYSGDRLLSARTIRFEEDIRTFYDGYDYRPEFHDLTAQRRHFVLDFAGERGSAEYLTQIGPSQFHALIQVEDNRQIMTDFGNLTYRDLGEQSFYGEFGATIRTSDLLLARELLSRPEDARLDGQEMWLGRWHHKMILADQNGGPEMTLLVDIQSGRISQMYRYIGTVARPSYLFDRPTRVSYTFDRPTAYKGLRFASEHSVFAGNRLLYLSLNRKYQINARADRHAFRLPKGATAEPQRVDQSTMTAESVAEGVYHIGQGEAYSTFFIRPSGIIAFGLQAGFSERLTAFREETGNEQPLTYAVAATHHAGKTAGADEALDAGAELVVTTGARDRLADSLDQLNKGRAVETDLPLEGLQILSFPSAHASQNLAVFDPVTGVLAQIYHYGNPYADASFFAVALAPTLHDAIQKRGLKPNILLSTAFRKPVPYSEFETAVNNFNGHECPRDRRICQGTTP